jgi:hypothetical protein
LSKDPAYHLLSPHEALFSTLKNENISAEDYQLYQRVWEDNDMKTSPFVRQPSIQDEPNILPDDPETRKAPFDPPVKLVNPGLLET